MTSRVVALRIRGGVQRVGYRRWLQRGALARSVSGWVRNRADGSVEALLGGQPGAIEDLIDLCWRGPPGAQVRAVDVSDVAEDAETGAGAFEIRPTL